MRYYIADLHFGHENLNDKMDCRGFASLEEMNEAMIAAWNSRVKKKDEVVVLGDFCVGTAADATAILERLNGIIYMIRGNHDHFLDQSSFDDSRFVWVRDYAQLHDNGRTVILSHYPMLAYNGQYRSNKEGEPKTFMLYGHVHDTAEEGLIEDFVLATRKVKKPTIPDGELKAIPCNLINCFCMYSNYVPLTLDEWIALTEERLRLREVQKRQEEGRRE